MSNLSSVEERLARVEKELAELKSRVGSSGVSPNNWIDTISGSFKDDAEFAEIVRLGKEIRDADKPAAE